MWFENVIITGGTEAVKSFHQTKFRHEEVGTHIPLFCKELRYGNLQTYHSAWAAARITDCDCDGWVSAACGNMQDLASGANLENSLMKILKIRTTVKLVHFSVCLEDLRILRQHIVCDVLQHSMGATRNYIQGQNKTLKFLGDNYFL